MAAPIEIYEQLTRHLMAQFLSASPDVPLVRRKIEETFEDCGMIHDTGDELDLWKLLRLAEDLGLEITMTLVKKASP